MNTNIPVPDKTDQLSQDYRSIREETHRICSTLAIEDYGIQTMADVSPPKWHIAHTSWFFETFLLKPYLRGYREFHPVYAYLFNSYYEQAGKYYPRPDRGQLSRPTVEEVYQYRKYVDDNMMRLVHSLETQNPVNVNTIRFRTLLGLNHEQQHQELMFMDIKHIFGKNPLRPVYRKNLKPVPENKANTMSWVEFDEGVYTIGADSSEIFVYDNETPNHNVYVNPFRLSTRLVTNKEFLEFIDNDGYKRAELWLSDGWKTVQEQHWQMPLYWEYEDGRWSHMTLGGICPIDESAPVSHVSYYEADAFSRWRQKRLPTEQEWEVAASSQPISGNFREAGYLQPVSTQEKDITQLYGDVWEWTQSAYAPYPGYSTPVGAIGEYNGKFMCSQMVLRGGSCVTPVNHIRKTYRNFFYPADRWQFSGLRLADDLT